MQEALINSACHAGTTATIRACCGGGGLIVEVADDAAASSAIWLAPRTSRTGNGIAGTTERAQVLVGAVNAGSGPRGGFRVLAWLPLRGGPR